MAKTQLSFQAGGNKRPPAVQTPHFYYFSSRPPLQPVLSSVCNLEISDILKREGSAQHSPFTISKVSTMFNERCHPGGIL